MRIGEVARRLSLPAKTIRYYESVGLLPPPARSDSNYRDYDDRDVMTLRFVQRARSLGFSLKEIAALLALWRDNRRASAVVRRLAEDHIATIDSRIAELKAMRGTLQHLIARCHGDDRPDCPIIDELASPSASETSPAKRKRSA